MFNLSVFVVFTSFNTVGYVQIPDGRGHYDHVYWESAHTCYQQYYMG